ncbi:MAG TPA: DUF2933 domain-containing protein [Aromatoleum sp.]|uniref:DUF2933 domain-containing protein n=1 Tax=Aromatoleum sp. TaxID=2307007 RepID=UPI002B47C15D|nr:DUF2933 domain-containing protein [Aromatoleum sp.]HJV26783.1 DUF2933 domain-containing protein [Aromatoleum sp.]
MDSPHPLSRATREGTPPGRPARRTPRVFGVFVAIAAVLLAFEHRAHLLGILPWLFLLACPLMHLFMHHDHGAHGHRHDASKGGDT